MNPSRSSYVEYGTGNMLNLEVGTIKRKLDSNEYDDETLQEVQPNGKRTCSPMNGSANQFSSFGRASAPQTPNGASAWSQAQSNPSPLLRTAMNSSASAHGFALNTGYQTPESAQSSVAVSPMVDTDMDMETGGDSGAPFNHGAQASPMMVQNANAMLSAAVSSPMTNHSSSLLPSALPGQHQFANNNQNGMDTMATTNTAPVTEYVPIHGRSMEIPSYARVPMNEARKYRDQRWSSCIYGADTRLGQGMMI
ncbi:hypothetical protein EMPS_01328 [Entomortierella parvispora]|uniref:Uncharacterized protein n=1 Tax=Entomortierella parvispora TaxID=205924 RepID=A0A9P3H2R8_9FUNG|nr:hypothetical protein EMPS_01328 [Entomortierella parvispora]